MSEPQKSPIDDAAVQELSLWLVAAGRLMPTHEALVEALAQRVNAWGCEIMRIRIGHRLSNPLLLAWGAVWTEQEGAKAYVVDRTTMSTDDFKGSPFEAIIVGRTPKRYHLETLVRDEVHNALQDFIDIGGTDYLGLPLIYGDGSVQAMSFITRRPGGFTPDMLQALERLCPFIAAAVEPFAMRRSTESLLTTYLGIDPARRILAGAFHRGDLVGRDAVVMMCDLRASTAFARRNGEEALLGRLSLFFEAVTEAVHKAGGDVLKVIGDGLLSAFTVDEKGSIDRACDAAVSAALAAREKLARATPVGGPIQAAMVLHAGPIVYGNIGSMDRLDFTVVGTAVNELSRLEQFAKQHDHTILATRPVVEHASAVAFRSIGRHQLRDFDGEVELFVVPG